MDRRHRRSLGARHSACAVLGAVRRRVVAFARERHQDDLAALFVCGEVERAGQAKALVCALEVLRWLPAPEPQVIDPIDDWLPRRARPQHRHRGNSAQLRGETTPRRTRHVGQSTRSRWHACGVEGLRHRCAPSLRSSCGKERVRTVRRSGKLQLVRQQFGCKCDCIAMRSYRITKTEILLWVSTLCVSLPKSKA